MSEPLWTAAEAARATSGIAKGIWSARGIGIDSRSLAPGDLFVALIDKRDGHQFIPHARQAGAAAVVATGTDTGAPALIVDDTLTALEALARNARERAQCYRVAITGSVGKTSLKEMCGRIFDAGGSAHCSVRSYNNHWGVPLSLAAMPRNTRRAVFEIGMNAPGEIEPLARLVEPHCAVVTRIAEAHLLGLGDIDAVAREKAKIFAGLSQNAVAVIPAGDRFSAFLAAEAKRHAPRCRIHSFGTSTDASARLTNVRTENGAIICTADILGETVTVRLDVAGQHWGLNAIAALLIGRLADLCLANCAAALDGFAPPEGRGRAHGIGLTDGGRVRLLDDSYNANPASMRAGLAALASFDGRKLAVLGAMKELGPDSDRLHAALAEPIRAAGVGFVFLLGDEMQPLAEALASRGVQTATCEDSTSLADTLIEKLRDGDTVLVKGSNASNASCVADALRARAHHSKGVAADA